MPGQEFIKRIKTAVILCTVISLAVINGAWWFIGLIGVINFLSLREFYRLFSTSQASPQKINGMLLSLGILVTGIATAAVTAIPGQWLYINLPLVVLVYTTELYRKKHNPFLNIAITFLGIIFITLPLGFLGGIAFIAPGQGRYHALFIFLYFILLWASDTGAYFAGKMFGRHFLFKRISPHKTWEGSIGGLLACITVAWVASCYTQPPARWKWLVIALIIVITGTLGDLSKSLMKRSLHVKDCGNILPGHGGMIDRFDSLFGSAPFVFAFLKLFPDA